MSNPCNSLFAGQADKGDLISHGDAKKLLVSYLDSAGEVQPARDNEDHIYGFLYGINKIKKMLDLIDKHNETATEKISAIRIYKAKSKRSKDAPLMNDLLLVPVRDNGIDYPESLALDASANMILSNSGPCPNVCRQLFFSTLK